MPSSCKNILSKDSRTLLSTPRSGQVNLTKIGGGEYVHFGISTGLLYSLKHFTPVKNLSILDVWFNIDGLPIDKKGKSFWPILCAICFESTIMKPFIVGAYFGSKKPYNVREYLYPFVEELNYLLEHGLVIDDNTININMKGIVADAPARAFIKQIKGHSGYFACEKCIEEPSVLNLYTYFEAKRRLIKFCKTSATETEKLLTSKPRVRIQKRKYSSSEEETSFISTLNNPNLSRNVKVTQQTQHTEVQKGIINIPKPKKSIDFFGADDEGLQHIPNIDDDDQGLQGYIPQDCNVPSPEMFPEKNTSKNYSQDEHIIISIHDMLNNIGHAVMDVSNELKTLKKVIHIIKVDVMKNQEILSSLAENDRRTVSSVDTRQAINRASLKIPVQTISELNEIEEYEDKLSTLARILQRVARSFDAKRTTYMAMKLIMQNRLAEFLNMEGRRGEKPAFVKYKIYTTVIDCVSDTFPIVSLIEIKGHISDWLKQAPRRK